MNEGLDFEDDECEEFMPQEYFDSDKDEDFSYLNNDNPFLFQRIVQKAYSVNGIRKLNYIFKVKRREIFNKYNNFQE